MTENLNDDLIKLLMALLIGAVIGAEREYKSKAVGFRTIILITVGSCLFTILSRIMGGERDPARVAANIITGIGFLGAGAIFKEGVSVRGVTTAATIWIAAAIGMATGVAQYEFAFMVAAIVMLVLLGFTWFQNIIDKTNTNKSYRITLVGNSQEKLKELEGIFKELRLKARCNHYAKISNEMILTYQIQGSEKEHNALVIRLYETSLVDSFEC
jgi:putative Mg2+ transporter-C (MgtC) family protein